MSIEATRVYPTTRGNMQHGARYAHPTSYSPTPLRTFLLYLDSCGEGGETLLLEREGTTFEASGRVLSAVRPLAGRLLVFPHKCPHAGALVMDSAPKLVLRGELY